MTSLFQKTYEFSKEVAIKGFGNTLDQTLNVTYRVPLTEELKADNDKAFMDKYIVRIDAFEFDGKKIEGQEALELVKSSQALAGRVCTYLIQQMNSVISGN